MRKLYVACRWVQYAIWVLYLTSLLILYVLGFFLDTLSVRWLLMPETVGVLLASIALSVIIVSIFVFQRLIGKTMKTAEKFGLLGALPSMCILAAAIMYFVG